jgi:hypothetical protein
MSSLSPATKTGGGRADEVLARLNRAVQRATIYPEGHPAIRAAVTPFVDSVRGALEARPSLMFGVGRDRLGVPGEPPSERASAFSWLAQHLQGRGLASLTFQGPLTEDDAVRFVLWLGRPETGPEGEAQDPRFEGISYARFDYSLARFREGAAADDLAEAEAARSWVSVVGSLTDGWFSGGQAVLSGDPEALAREVGAQIARNEGVGSAILTARLVALGGSLAQLPRSVRAAVKTRLGNFIGGLTPDLQSELLRIAPDSDPARMAFVSEMLDALPDPVVMDVLAGVEASGAHVPRQFITFMQMLVGLSARDPVLAEATENRLESLGLPRSLATQSPAEVKAALEEVLGTRVDDTAANPEAYQARLEQLSARRIRRVAEFTEGRHGDPQSEEQVAVHVTEIVQRLLVASPQSPEAPRYLERLLADAPRALRASRFDFVYGTAMALRELKPPRAPEEVASLAAGYAAALCAKENIDAVLDAVERSPTATPAMVGLFRLGGGEAACAAVERIDSATGEGRERLVDLVVFLEARAFSEAVVEARRRGLVSPTALLALLGHPGAPGGPDLVRLFLDHRDADIRLEALRMLFDRDPNETSFESFLESALSDPDPQIVAFGLQQARRRKEPAIARLLGEYLEGALGGNTSPNLQVLAVEELAEAGSREARDVLIEALAGRGLAFGAGSRAVAREMASTLERIGDDAALAAFRRWRRSAAGLLSRILDPRGPS